MFTIDNDIHVDDRIIDKVDHYEFFLIAHLAKRLPTIHPSLKTLIKETGFSKKKLLSTIKSLEQKKIIRVKRQKGDSGRSEVNTYFFTTRKVRKFNSEDGVTNVTTGEGQNLARGVVTNVTTGEGQNVTRGRGKMLPVSTNNLSTNNTQVLTNTNLKDEAGVIFENSVPLKPQKSTERKKVAPKKESPFFDEQKMSEEFKTFLRLFTDEYGGHASSTTYAWNYFKTSCTNSAMDWRKEVFKLKEGIEKLIDWRVRAKAHNERNFANQVQIPKPCGTNRYFDERRWQIENYPMIGNEKPKPKPHEKKAAFESPAQKIAYIEKLIERKMISNDRFSIELKRINGDVTTEQYNTEAERLKAANLWEIKRPSK